MAQFSLKDSEDYYLALTDHPKRFDADSPVTNVFFDDTNGQVFTVRSGGVTGVTVTSMDESKCTSFRMEDRGPIISIKFSLDQNILAIQRNYEHQSATVEFVNFKDQSPTNVEYSHTCKWKNAKILGFVWSKVNEIAFITDHGLELLQVLPEKKQLKSLKNISFSGAWFSWCPQSNIVLLAGNNGALLQPFSLNNSTITKLQKLEMEGSKPVVERDVFLLRLCDATWCAVFRHGSSGGATVAPTEVWMWAVGGAGAVRVLRTALAGRFAVSVVDDLLVVHHQSSQTSQIFDIQEECKMENNMACHSPAVRGAPLRPAAVDAQPCPMYSATWVVFQPDYIIDARLGCLWRVRLHLPGLLHRLPKDDLPRTVGALLRRTRGEDTVYRALRQLVAEADAHLVQLGRVFDELNVVYRRWAEQELARNTAGGAERRPPPPPRVLITQSDVCDRVLHPHADHPYLVQTVTSYLASLARHELVVQSDLAALSVRALVTRGGAARLRALVRRGALTDSRPLACQLLSLGHLDKHAAQLALDMLWRLKGYEEVVEVLLSWDEPVAAGGAARQAGAWGALPARKLLAAARERPRPAAFLAVYRALVARNLAARGAPHFLKSEQCEPFVEYYKQLTSEQ